MARARKPHGKKLKSREQKFQYIPNGIPGLETRLPLLFSGGVNDGRNSMLHHDVDYTPYEGRTVTGWPVMTLSRGKLVSKDFEFVGTPGAGAFMRCDKPML